MTLLEIATRAVCQEMGLHRDQWESFSHLSQVAFKAIAEHLPEDVRTLFVAGSARPLSPETGATSTLSELRQQRKLVF